MKYFLKPQEEIEIDSERKRYGFLFIPKKICDEIRWLEWAGWVEVAEQDFIFCECLAPWKHKPINTPIYKNLVRWQPIRWINK